MSLSDLLSFAVLFLLLSIFLSHELFATGLPFWRVLLSWLLSAYLVGVLCFLLSQMLWPQGRLPLFVTAVFGFLTVLFNYVYLFPKAPKLDRAFCFFFVVNTATLLELAANVLARAIVRSQQTDVVLLAMVLFVFGSLFYGLFFYEYFKNILLRALPAALTDLFLVEGVTLFYLAAGLEVSALSTISAGIMGVVGMMMVCRTAKPMHKWHVAMVAALSLVFAVCYFFLNRWFNLVTLDFLSALVLTVFALLAWPVMTVMQRLVDKLRELWNGLKEKWRLRRA